MSSINSHTLVFAIIVISDHLFGFYLFDYLYNDINKEIQIYNKHIHVHKGC